MADESTRWRFIDVDGLVRSNDRFRLRSKEEDNAMTRALNSRNAQHLTLKPHSISLLSTLVKPTWGNLFLYIVVLVLEFKQATDFLRACGDICL